MALQIRNHSRINVKVNDSFLDVLVQWGVEDIRTGKIVRAALTRETARNFAKRSSFFRVVKRDFFPSGWYTD